ncbi:MAG: hypothetical protein HXY40_04310 [Chloroflexi bacterium]|nr:hypothetical protein [Chloroflexota bacterium]
MSGRQWRWRNFVNWIRSLAEYGAGWQPPLIVLPPDAIAYPASILQAQHQIVEELRL